jgi:AAA+ ATPase superfamily predicted ATPase
MKSLDRPNVHQQLQRFCFDPSDQPGLMFVRGRRRVGKTWALQSLTEELKSDSFTILCRKHTRDSSLRSEIVKRWIIFHNKSALKNRRQDTIEWQDLFDDISSFSNSFYNEKQKPFVLIIDEVQWLSSTFDDSAGLLKQVWDSWMRYSKLRVICCGSSTRFFEEQRGEEKPIRGINTSADVDVLPFPISIIKSEIVPNWSLKDSVLAYLCIGGVPYYWARLKPHLGFRAAMNEALFTKSTIFLQEWKDIISTEFRTDAAESLSKLFPSMMAREEGSTQSEIAGEIEKSDGAVASLLVKLVNYGYAIKSEPDFFHSPEQVERREQARKTGRGSRYILADFYLHFYFTILRTYEPRISINDNDLIFPYEVLTGNQNDYIQNFTGKAFERFVFYHVDVAIRKGDWINFNHARQRLSQALQLSNYDYSVFPNVLIRGDKSERIISQIDVLIVHDKEKTVRVIECKWKNDGSKQDVDDALEKVIPKKYKDYTRLNFLAAAYDPSSQLKAYAKSKDVNVITLEDFL